MVSSKAIWNYLFLFQLFWFCEFCLNQIFKVQNYINRNQNVVLAKLLHKLNENTRETKNTENNPFFNCYFWCQLWKCYNVGKLPGLVVNVQDSRSEPWSLDWVWILAWKDRSLDVRKSNEKIKAAKWGKPHQSNI